MSQLRIYLLGRFQAYLGDKQLAGFDSQTAESLFAYLVTCRDRPQSRDLLVGLFWPEDDEKRAKSKLRDALYRIRKSLQSVDLAPDDYILKQGQNLQFNPKSTFWLDVAQFEELLKQGIQLKDTQRLQQAVEFHRGAFLEGFYEDWVMAEQSRINDLYLKALDALVQQHEERKEYDQAIRYAQRSLACNPLQDQLHFTLIQLLSLSGDRNAALQQYEEYCRILKEELPDAHPLPEIAELIDTIKKQKRIELRIKEPAKGYAKLMDAFVGRQRELESLLLHLQHAQAGNGGLVLVEGEAGIGKTRLVQEFLARARESGSLVLIGRCYQAREGLPYLPLIEALRGYLEQPHALADLPKHVPKVWLGELVKLLPELVEKLKVEANPPLSGEQERNRLYEGLTQVFVALSRDRPLVLVLEDLHWADIASAEYLKYLMRRLPHTKLMVVGTYRIEELDEQHVLLDIRTQVLREAVGEILRLGTLTAPDVENLIEGMMQSREVALQLSERLFQEARGHPLFVIERIKALAADGALSLTKDQKWQLDVNQLKETTIPSTVQEVILSRLRRVKREAQEAYKLLAVLGRPAELEILVEADGKNESAMLEHLEELSQKHLVSEDAQGYSFTHQLVGTVIYNQLGEGQRCYFHRRIGEALETVYANRQDDITGELAHHFTQGQRWMKALKYRLTAAERAVRSYATSAAFAHLEQARTLADELAQSGRDLADLATARFDILRNLGNIHWNSGNYELARDSWQQALKIAQAITDTGRMGKAYGNLALLCWTLGQHDQARDYHQKSLELFEEVGDKRGMALTLNNLGALHWSLGDYEEASKYWQKALNIAQEIRDRRVQGMSLGNIALVHHILGQYQEARKTFEQSLAIAQETRDKYQIALNFSSVGLVHQALGEYGQALGYQEKAVAIFREIDDKRQVSEALQNLASVSLDLKQYDTALEHLREALEIANRLGLKAIIVQSLSLQAKAELALGQSKQALKSSEEAVRLLEEQKGVESPQKVYFTHSQILRAVGQESEARSYLQKAFEVVQQQAKRIQDETVRQSFLTQIKENRAILEQWEQIHS